MYSFGEVKSFRRYEKIKRRRSGRRRSIRKRRSMRRRGSVRRRRGSVRRVRRLSPVRRSPTHRSPTKMRSRLGRGLDLIRRHPIKTILGTTALALGTAGAVHVAKSMRNKGITTGPAAGPAATTHVEDKT